jgi:MATE family multidrug resistance protein
VRPLSSSMASVQTATFLIGIRMYHITYLKILRIRFSRAHHMESTNCAQHQPHPSSLPSDYALLSRYAQHRPGTPPANDGPISENLPRRRLSQPTVRNHPLDRGSLSIKNVRHTESTPLLPRPPPSFPYIEEDVDRDDSSDNHSLAHVFREELPILTKYSLPVFGQVDIFCIILSF